MNASEFEQELAQKNGVLLRTNLQPTQIMAGSDASEVGQITFEYTDNNNGKLVGTGESMSIACDHLLVAIGQSFQPAALQGSATQVSMKAGRIEVDENRRSSDTSIWAGGDCIAGGDDLTVSAVQDGKMAAESIHQTLEHAHG